MRDLSTFINESKDEKFFNSIKNILEKDRACQMVLGREKIYDENRRNSSQKPRVLFKENDGYEWYTFDMVDEQLDIAAPKDIVGIFINRMFYPLSSKELILDIVKKYNEE